MNWTPLLLVIAVVGTMLLMRRSSLVPEAQARELLKQGAMVVDVRGVEEFEAGHLPGTVNMPLGALREAADRLAPDKGRALLLHCVSGMRSGMARRQLRALGYEQVFNLGSYDRARGILSGA